MINSGLVTNATITTGDNMMTTENEILDNGTLIEIDVNNVDGNLIDNNIIDDDKSILSEGDNNIENKQENNNEVLAIGNAEMVNSDNIDNGNKKVNLEKKLVKKDSKDSDDESLDNDEDIDEVGNSDLSDKDKEYFEALYKKYSEHKNPSQAMKLLLKLHDLETKTESDFSQIKILLRAEKARVKAENARNRVNAIFKAEANANRKKVENKKFILGGALYSGIENNLMLTANISFKQIARMMIDKKMITGDDVAKIRELIDKK